jgi:alkylation response protein AidB-like acyl-CoA dehydrogenase
MAVVADLLERVAGLRDEIEDGGRRSDELRTCPPDLVEALRDAELFALKVPRDVGGLELSFLDQMAVYEAVARIDANVGWTVIIGNGVGGIVGGRLSDEAAAVVYSSDRPPLMAGAVPPVLLAEPERDGYRVSGRASFGSGIHHAEWVATGGFVADGTGRPDLQRGPRVFVVPRHDVTLVDNWHVAGLKGTGSCDYVFADVHVAEAFVIDPFAHEARRGGPAYTLSAPVFVGNEHMAFMLGAARRALDEVTASAAGKLRLGSTATLAARGAFQQQLARHEIALRGARLLAHDVVGRLWAGLEATGAPPSGAHLDVMAVSTHVAETATAVATWGFKATGAHGLFLGHPAWRCLRDILAGAQHIYVKDENLDVWGGRLLGMD